MVASAQTDGTSPILMAGSCSSVPPARARRTTRKPKRRNRRTGNEFAFQRCVTRPRAPGGSCRGPRPALSFGFERRGSPKLRCVNRYVDAYVVHLERVASIQPGEGEFERHLDAVDVAVVGVINLGWKPADRGTAVPDHSREKSRLLVEVQRREQTAGSVALHHIDLAIVDRGRLERTQIGQNLLDLRRERHLGIEPGAVQLASAQLIFP